MGTWSSGLYDDDHALDVKSFYKDLRRASIVGSQATPLLIENCFEGDRSNLSGDPTFWLVVADLQWKDGVLDPLVAKHANRIVLSGEGLELWDDPIDRRQRERIQQRIGKLLETEMPAAKPLAVPYFDASIWDIGDVVAYRLNEPLSGSGHAVVLLQVVDHFTKLGGDSPVFELMKWCGESVPSQVPPDLEALTTTPVPGMDLRVDETLREQVRVSIAAAQAEGTLSAHLSLEDVVRDKMSTRVPVVSLTGREKERRRITKVGTSDRVIAKDKILTTMVWQSWKDFDSFVASEYERHYEFMLS